MEKQFSIEGFLIDRLSKKGIADLEVETWEKDSRRDDFLGRATSAADGSFSFSFSDKDYRDYRGFAENVPNVYFKVFLKDNLITETNPQKISTFSPINKLKKIIEIPDISKTDNSISINDWNDMIKHEDTILKRIKALPNGSNAFIANPLLCIAEVGVRLSEEFREELIGQHPTLAMKSAIIFRAILNNEMDNKININLRGLFRRFDK